MAFSPLKEKRLRLTIKSAALVGALLYGSQNVKRGVPQNKLFFILTWPFLSHLKKSAQATLCFDLSAEFSGSAALVGALRALVHGFLERLELRAAAQTRVQLRGEEGEPESMLHVPVRRRAAETREPELHRALQEQGRFVSVQAELHHVITSSPMGGGQPY